MTPLVTIILGSVFCGWAFLTLLGGERTRQTNDLKAKIAARNAPPEKPAAKALPAAHPAKPAVAPDKKGPAADKPPAKAAKSKNGK